MLYARNDIQSISLGENGCGQNHSRPPGVRTWRLDCEACCRHLSGAGKQPVLKITPGDPKNGIPAKQERILPGDPHWSPKASQIPETYDEIADRLAHEGAGRQNRDMLLRAGNTRIAGRQVSPKLGAMLKGVTALPSKEAVIFCPDCQQDNVPSAKFCSNCGTAVRHPAAI